MTAQKQTDEFYMRRCLALAEKALGKVSPNPMVGCVIVRDGTIVAEGFHTAYGNLHAEAEALKSCGDVSGATMYVNLEPCAHEGKRQTTPCSPKVVASNISRLVVGAEDPIASHAGGIAAARAAGIEVKVGVLRDECVRLNSGFYNYASTSSPYVIAKVASSVDGRIALASGESKWVTNESSRRHARKLRQWADVLITGAGTVVADNPRLTSRLGDAKDPTVAIVDSALITPSDAALFDATREVIVFTVDDANPDKQRTLEERGAEVLRMGAGRVDLQKMIAELGRRKMTCAMLEAGHLCGQFLSKKLAHELHLYIAPKVLGPNGVGWSADGSLDASLTLKESCHFSGDVLHKYWVNGTAAWRDNT